MKSDLARDTDSRVSFDYPETAGLVEGIFSWSPGALTRLLIHLVSRLVSPLEEGTVGGRRLEGDPHRPRCVIAGRLTVFAVEGRGHLRDLVLAARLRHREGVNMVYLGGGNGRKRLPFRGSFRGGPGRGDGKRDLAQLVLGTVCGPVEGPLEQGPLQSLLAIQKHSDYPLTVIPVARASHQVTANAPTYSTISSIRRFAPLNLARKIASLARTLRTGRVKNCRPLVLSEWLSSEEGDSDSLAALAKELKLELTRMIESEKRASCGPPLEPVVEVRRRVLSDPFLSSYMQEYAMEQRLTPGQVHAEARMYVEEIASDYRVGVVRWFARFVDFLFDRLLEGFEIDREGIRFLSECDTRDRVVLVCSHKSYLDPLMIGYVMFRSGLVPPQQAAGLNLSFWPVGWLLRHSGAFYLRRTFAGETLYRQVFDAYVRHILADNYTSAVYVEGTRSRNGRLSPPRLGYLGILEDSLRMGVCRDVILVPVYLGYDKVPEERSHVREMEGGRKSGESVRGFARLYRSINTTLGKAYVKFGKPLSMKKLLDDHDVGGIAQIACQGIEEATPLTARSLAAAALLVSPAAWVSEESFASYCSVLLEVCGRGDAGPAVGMDEVWEAVDWLCRDGHVSRKEVGGRGGFLVEGRGRRFLEYNKNIISGRFKFESMVCSCALKAGCRVPEFSSVMGDLEFLLDKLDCELVVGEETCRKTELKRAFEFLDSLESPGRETAVDVLSSLLQSTMEGYMVAARALAAVEPGLPMDRDDFTDLCFEMGGKMLRDGTVLREESISRTTFKNAQRKFGQLGLTDEVELQGSGERKTVALVRRASHEGPSELAERLLSFLHL